MPCFAGHLGTHLNFINVSAPKHFVARCEHSLRDRSSFDNSKGVSPVVGVPG